MTNHPNLTGAYPAKIRSHFSMLKKLLAEKSVRLVIHGNGILKGI
jgi:hypothetical protein